MSTAANPSNDKPQDGNPFSISEIYIDKLFGTYTYTVPNELKQDFSRVMIIYGDNGTGKTTLVRLCFYLLSTKLGSGYKTILANTKFRKISIRFANGIEIGAVRQKELIGGYEYYISKDNKKIQSITFEAEMVDEAYSIDLKGKDNSADLHQMYSTISDLKITAFLLTDTRTLLHSHLSSMNDSDKDLEDINYYSASVRRIASAQKREKYQAALRPNINKLNKWIGNKVLAGSRMGEKKTQAIFTDIIKDYIKLSNSDAGIKDRDSILNDLKLIEQKIPPFVKLGLLDAIDAKSIKKSITNAKTNEEVKFLNTIISPFLEGINARMIALETVQSTIELFIDTINDYFTNKVINFNINTGFILKQIDGDVIEFKWLSSGERQLLFLLINIITSADEATIFIIDEPEISLNIKWQRKLIRTLLAFSSEKNIQFIFASHSFEILSGYMKSTTKLINKND